MFRKLASILLATMLVLSLGLMAACDGSAPGGQGSGSGSQNANGPGDGSGNAGDTAPVKFTVAFCTWIGYAPLFIAQDQGYFAANGVAPELKIIEDESQYAAALFSNSIQALGNVLDREVIHYASGTPETVIFAMDESSGGDGVIATGDIKTVADLKGKTVGLDKSSTSYFFFLSILDESGLSEAELTIQDMGADDAGTAFLAGRLDAAVVWEPYLSEANSREGGHVLVSSADYPKTIVDVMVMRSDFIEANPEAVKGFTAAWYQAIEFYKANPEKGNEIMARGLGLETQEVADMAAGITFMGAEENKVFMDKSKPDSLYEVAERAATFWKGMGIIKGSFDADAFISDKYYTVSPSTGKQ